MMRNRQTPTEKMVDKVLEGRSYAETKMEAQDRVKLTVGGRIQRPANRQNTK